jgi:TM2 domain-containing membrane protein YozV
MPRPNLVTLIPAIEGEELVMLQSLTRDMNDDQLISFVKVYNNRRRKTDQVLLGCVLGFAGIGGIQRFMTGQTGMGVIYFLTGGLFLIGTIVDTVNHKKLCFRYNQKAARETLALLKAYS